ncbi:hypothetical protein E2C01_023781 [Portunus trituberculatus]|uniref:Uncharacterized protein n=1 Tax=Portunus trituberculatus TaxID=210409 RepID=A0A5B7ECJ3_PORTR|nr:hypothetical protein [Portunus trituberculatus]
MFGFTGDSAPMADLSSLSSEVGSIPGYLFHSFHLISRKHIYYTNRGAAVVQWNHACFGIRGVSKRTGSNPVHGQSVGWASLLGATVS